MHSIWHDGNRKADELYMLSISLLKGLSYRAEANPDDDQANVVNIPATDIRMIRSKNSGLYRQTLYDARTANNSMTDETQNDSYENSGKPTAHELADKIAV